MEIAAKPFQAAAARLALAVGAAVLAYDPLVWLIRTWRDPSYDSQGFLVFAICLALFAWSVTSPRAGPSQDAATPSQDADDSGRARWAILILVSTALIRLTSQLVAINTLGALALVADVYAIGLLAGLHTRRRALSPAWLAVCFAFALPLERIVQRTMGYPLQSLSADGACSLLQGLFDDVACQGVRIVLQGRDVLVDLPCSGAQALLLLLLFYCVTAALARPGVLQAILGLGLTLAVAFIANVVRIIVLAIGIAFHPTGFPVDVMAQPWHDLIGLMILGASAMPVIVWARSLDRAETMPFFQHERPRPRHGLRPTLSSIASSPARRPAAPLAGALAFLAASLAIIVLPRHALDVAKRDISIVLPDRIDGRLASPTPLSARETAYFVQFGGAAAKADYGSTSLLVVRTSSPLRHLHAPDECLRGLGFSVDYLGLRHAPAPTAVYRATAPDGQVYRIAVSFVSDGGQTAASVAHASWIWLQQPQTVWTAIQRISPWDTDAADRDRFERGVIAAFDLPVAGEASDDTLEIAGL